MSNLDNDSDFIDPSWLALSYGADTVIDCARFLASVAEREADRAAGRDS